MNARYEPLVKLASGGMATVWIGAARGALGFRQLVAIKRPHPHLLEQAGAKQELVEEARLASMIRHANVVDVRDVEEDGDGISLVMDFIEGASLGELLVAGPIPPRVVIRVIRDACAGLHAAHELVDERGRAVGLIHRDISPQNILVGEDGIARVTDFGVAKFARKDGSKSTTGAGTLKGKLAYMAPEYLRNEPIDRRVDVFALGVVLWECLAGARLFRGAAEPDTYVRVLEHRPLPVSVAAKSPALEPLDAIVACALEKDANARFQNAHAMGVALEDAATEAGLMGTPPEVVTALRELAGAAIARRREEVRAKLAHEPSLASLGLAPLTSPVPDTIRSEPVLAPTTLPLGAPAGKTLPLATPRGQSGASQRPPVEEPLAQPVTSNAYELGPPPQPKRRGVVAVAGLALAAVAGLVAFATHESSSRKTSAPATDSAAAESATGLPSVAVPGSSDTGAPSAPSATSDSAASAPNPHPSADAPSGVHGPRNRQDTAKSAPPNAHPAAPPVASVKHPPANPYE